MVTKGVALNIGAACLVLCGCIGDLDPNALANFSTRLEKISEIRVEDGANRWITALDGDSAIFIANGVRSRVSTNDVNPEESTASIRALVGMNGRLAGGELTVASSMLLLGARQTKDSEATAADFLAGEILSLLPGDEGDYLGEFLFPEDDWRANGTLAAVDGLMVVAVQEPSGLAIFSLNEGVGASFEKYIGTEGFEDVHALTLVRSEGGYILYSLAPNQLTAQFVSDDLELSTGTSLSLRAMGVDVEVEASSEHGHVLVDRDSAYIVDLGRWLFVADIQEALNPRIVKRISGFNRAQFVAADNGHLVVANGASGLVFLKASDARDPQILNYSNGGAVTRVVFRWPLAFTSGSQPIVQYRAFSPDEF